MSDLATFMRGHDGMHQCGGKLWDQSQVLLHGWCPGWQALAALVAAAEAWREFDEDDTEGDRWAVSDGIDAHERLADAIDAYREATR